MPTSPETVDGRHCSLLAASRGHRRRKRFRSVAGAGAAAAYPDDNAPSAREVIVAAGGIVTRRTPAGDRQVLVVHRAHHDDWSFPKGKVDDDETEAEAALREVREETGLTCSLGPRVGSVEYSPGGEPKIVTYWEMAPEGGEFRANDEVDAVAWLGVDEALERLTYDGDRSLLGGWLSA